MNPIKARILYGLLGVLAVFCLALSGQFSGTVSSGSGGGGEASCDGCNTSNDAVIAQDALTLVSNTSQAGIWLAWSFTTTGTKCITGGYFGCGGKNMDATFEIYTNNAGSPGSRVGDGYTKFKTDIPDTIADIDFIFDAVQTLPAGTYWIVWKADATNKPSYGYGETNTGWKYSTNSGSSWANSSYNMRAGVYGCDPS